MDTTSLKGQATKIDYYKMVAKDYLFLCFWTFCDYSSSGEFEAIPKIPRDGSHTLQSNQLK